MKQYRVHIGTDPNGNEIYRIEDIPDNKAIPINEAAKIHNENKRDIWAEAQKLIEYNARNKVAGKEKEFPESKRQQPKENEIKKFSKLLQDYRNN
jgi:hypothetical protein